MRKNLISRTDGVIKKVRRGVKTIGGNLRAELEAVVGVTRTASYVVPRLLLDDLPSIKVSIIDTVKIEKIQRAYRYVYKFKVTYKHGRIDVFWLNDKYFITKYESSIKRKDGVVLNKEIMIYPGHN